MEFVIIDSYKEFLSLENDWNRLLKNNKNWNFYQSFNWFYSVLSYSRIPEKKLFIIKIITNRSVIGILPLCINRKRLRFFTGKALEIIGNIYSPYRGFIVQKGSEKRVFNQLIDYLINEKNSEWDFIDFEDLSLGEETMTFLHQAIENRGIKSKISESFGNIKTKFSYSNSEDYFNSLSKNLRQQIKRCINKMNRKGDFDIVLTKNKHQDLEKAISHYYYIYQHSWKEPEADPEFHLKLAKYLADKDVIRLFILYYKTTNKENTEKKYTNTFPSYNCKLEYSVSIPNGYKPVAAYFFLVYRGRAYFLKTAYREDHKNFSPGTVLFWYSIKYLIDVDKCQDLDHQKGDENYKLKWGKVNEIRFKFQAPNPNSIFFRCEFWFQRNLIPKLRILKRLIKGHKSLI